MCFQAQNMSICT